MSPAAALLSALDDPRRHSISEATWLANLAALQARSAAAADWLLQHPLPPYWRCIVALDGWVTWRTELPGQPPRWLDDTAAPRSRAAGLLTGVDLSDRNIALLGAGAGAEIALLLERLPRYAAVFLLEPEPWPLRALLTAHDLVDALSTGRLILCSPLAVEAELSALLERQAGLLPPGRLICTPTVSAERVREVQGLCERLAARTAQARTAELANRIAAAEAERAPPVAAAERLALLALSGQPAAAAAAGRLAAAARDLGWQTLTAALLRPADAHFLPHCRAAQALQPTRSIAIGHPTERLPWPRLGRRYEWVIEPPMGGPAAAGRGPRPAGEPAAADLPLAASPFIRERLKAAGQGAVRDFFWACDAADLDLPVAASSAAPGLLLLGDLPDASAAAAGVQQPTHKLLWKALHELAPRLAFAPAIYDAAGLLQQAERQTGLRIGDAELRLRFEEVIAGRLVPAVLWDVLLTPLLSAGLRLTARGAGWERLGIATASVAAPSAATGNPGATAPAASGAAAALALSIGHPDPLAGGLILDAGARGIPLALHWVAERRGPLLGELLHPQQHFLPLRGLADVRSLAVRTAQAGAAPPAERRRAERWREHLRRHTAAQRLAELAGG